MKHVESILVLLDVKSFPSKQSLLPFQLHAQYVRRFLDGKFFYREHLFPTPVAHVRQLFAFKVIVQRVAYGIRLIDVQYQVLEMLERSGPVSALLARD